MYLDKKRDDSSTIYHGVLHMIEANSKPIITVKLSDLIPVNKLIHGEYRIVVRIEIEDYYDEHESFYFSLTENFTITQTN